MSKPIHCALEPQRFIKGISPKMMTLFRAENTIALSAMKAALKKCIQGLPDLMTPVGEPLSILRYEFPCEAVNVFAFLNQPGAMRKFYWNDRDDDYEVAGLGLADVIKGATSVDYKSLFEYMRDRLSPDNLNLRYYGGFAFNQNAIDRDWTPFGAYQFMTPRFELFKHHGRTMVALNISVADIELDKIQTILDELESIDFHADIDHHIPGYQTRTDFPDQGKWHHLFNSVQQKLKSEECAKIVLARKSVLDFQQTINPIALIKRLKHKTPRCYHFSFQVDNSSVFLGASPERLYKRQGRHVTSEALAGTKPRGHDGVVDKSNAEALINSSKEACEHQYVVDAIKNSFSELCRQFDCDAAPDLLTLTGGHHLVTPFEGVLKEGVGEDAIIPVLHPTPAVGGTPRHKAVEAIEFLEPFKRGWYASPVGCVGYDSADFTVAIRSGLIHQNYLSLFAGAGIVQDSIVENEWNEVETKIGRFIKVLSE